jgi:hypothetical protein
MVILYKIFIISIKRQTEIPLSLDERGLQLRDAVRLGIRRLFSIGQSIRQGAKSLKETLIDFI